MNPLLFLIFFLICAIIFYLLYKRITPDKKSNIKELYAEGLDMLVSGQKFSAYNNFKKIIKEDTNNIMAYIRLGQVLRENSNYVKAIKIHKNVLIRKKISDYHKIEVYKNLSLDYLFIENYAQSISYCDEILKIDSNNNWAF